MPDVDQTLPATCQLDRKRLTSIEAKLDLTLGKLEHLGSIDGPMGRLKEEIIRNVQRIDAAHQRIDAHDCVLERIGGRQWQIVWKTAAILGGSGGAMFVAVKILEAVVAK